MEDDREMRDDEARIHENGDRCELLCPVCLAMLLLIVQAGG
jgi:hypothetical protein